MFDITTSIDLTKLEPLNKEGKNSLVYSYHDKQLGKDFIVKVIENQTAYKQYGSDYINNLFTESKVLYANRHPHIVDIQYASYDEENVYISMPKYKNGSLDAIINKRYLTVREIIKFSLEFLSGLHYIHTNNLVHFDVKPTNILLNDNMKAVLTDFGLAKYVNEYGLATPDMIYNTHKPPEFFKNEKLSNKSDIYQAGVTLYRLCNGNATFKEQFYSSKNWEKDVMCGNLPNRKIYLPHIPKSLQKIINTAMEINPDKRYDTVLDMINKLSNISENLDWIFEEVGTNQFVWSRINEAGTHNDCIIMTDLGNDNYNIGAKKVNLSTNATINNNKFKHANVSLKDGNKLVADFIKQC